MVAQVERQRAVRLTHVPAYTCLAGLQDSLRAVRRLQRTLAVPADDVALASPLADAYHRLVHATRPRPVGG